MFTTMDTSTALSLQARSDQHILPTPTQPGAYLPTRSSSVSSDAFVSWFVMLHIMVLLAVSLYLSWLLWLRGGGRQTRSQSRSQYESIELGLSAPDRVFSYSQVGLEHTYSSGEVEEEARRFPPSPTPTSGPPGPVLRALSRQDESEDEERENEGFLNPEDEDEEWKSVQEAPEDEQWDPIIPIVGQEPREEGHRGPTLTFEASGAAWQDESDEAELEPAPQGQPQPRLPRLPSTTPPHQLIDPLRLPPPGAPSRPSRGANTAVRNGSEPIRNARTDPEDALARVRLNGPITTPTRQVIDSDHLVAPGAPRRRCRTSSPVARQASAIPRAAAQPRRPTTPPNQLIDSLHLEVPEARRGLGTSGVTAGQASVPAPYPDPMQRDGPTTPPDQLVDSLDLAVPGAPTRPPRPGLPALGTEAIISPAAERARERARHAEAATAAADWGPAAEAGTGAAAGDGGEDRPPSSFPSLSSSSRGDGLEPEPEAEDGKGG